MVFIVVNAYPNFCKYLITLPMGTSGSGYGIYVHINFVLRIMIIPFKVIFTSGGANISINFNTVLELDALTVSFDHDEEPTADQGLQFEWSCRQKEEV